MSSKLSRGLLIAPLLLLLNGCNLVVMHPSGDVAVQQRDLIIISSILMLIIIIPVMALTVFFAWKYRQSNKEAEYEPNWHHSTRLEVIIWSAPLLIIIALGAITWVSTHTLDPYRPLDRLDASRPVTQDMKPLTVEVVSMNWKWLFIYPELGIATVNEMAAPVDVPINFKITSSSIMNSFYIPALAGQIYAMAGMETKLHAVINKEGVYKGFSANYSGAGFSDMHFKFHGMKQADFDQWVEKVKSDGEGDLDRAHYLDLAKPTTAEPVHYYNGVDPDLFNAVVNMCVDKSKMCMNEMMMIDAQNGHAGGMPHGEHSQAGEPTADMSHGEHSPESAPMAGMSDDGATAQKP
ncbi:ubiquinol oxidase subunit II [Thalassospira mesophila]|uniref:ubiquinol oxidase subunit II n=1 Tax=Thalassospira mesophila TaxID=1293891 RepID=UPI000A1FEF8D|nr:ubiquinol oxidase subunit II [Thalassospira mesophila]